MSLLHSRYVRAKQRPPYPGGVKRRGPHPRTTRIRATIVKRVDGGWSFTWPEQGVDYHIWLDGELLETVTTPSYEFTFPDYDVPPDLEIVPDGVLAENEQYPPYVILQWRGIVDEIVAAYIVEQFVGAAWVTQATVMETKEGYYSWQSPPLTDNTTELYRVSAVDVIGNAGTPIAFTFDVIRNPEHPEVTITITGGNVVVSV